MALEFFDFFKDRGRLLGSLAVLGTSLTFLNPAQAIVIRDDVPDSSYLNLAQDSAYESVGRLTYNTSSGSFICSATLITSQWALTAAHCLDDASTSNVQFNVGGTSYSGTEWHINDDWNSSNLLGGNDLAVFRLSSEVTGVNPATLYTGLGDPGFISEFNQLSTAVGYGRSGTGLTGDTLAPGTRRAGQNFTYQRNVGAMDRLLWWDFDDPAGGGDTFSDGGAVALESLIAPGDSGGGLFVQYNSQWLLAGVSSFGAASFPDPVTFEYGDFAGFGRVSFFEDWIVNTTGYGTGTLSVPVTGSSWLLLLGLGLLAPRTRTDRSRP